ncbi:hypothetical protein KC957_04180 [Candidatus Saccharibacteria bacterium]|nr:hypothetical protein [Candidatus Saccharibacteria bacterium]
MSEFRYGDPHERSDGSSIVPRIIGGVVVGLLMTTGVAAGRYLAMRGHAEEVPEFRSTRPALIVDMHDPTAAMDHSDGVITVQQCPGDEIVTSESTIEECPLFELLVPDEGSYDALDQQLSEGDIVILRPTMTA